MDNEEKLQREVLHRINTYHCRKQPMYGRDMRLAVDTIHVPKQHHFRMSHQCSWLWSGYLCCQLQQVLQPKNLILYSTEMLQHLLVSYNRRMDGLSDVLTR